MENTKATARANNLRISPQKLNLVAQSIRGVGVSKAIASLTFSRENGFLNCKFTDSEWETEIGNLTHVAVKSILSSKIFFVSLAIFNSSFV